MKQALLKASAYLATLTKPAATYDFSTPDQARTSVRKICDEMGLTLAEKNLICQVIRGESGFKNTAKLENKDKYGKVWSTDWGICQINDHYHVGPNKRFPSVKYILNNPDKCVKWMITCYKQGHLSWWVAYSSGAYKNYQP